MGREAGEAGSTAGEALPPVPGAPNPGGGIWDGSTWTCAVGEAAGEQQDEAAAAAMHPAVPTEPPQPALEEAIPDVVLAGPGEGDDSALERRSREPMPQQPEAASQAEGEIDRSRLDGTVEHQIQQTEDGGAPEPPPAVLEHVL
eukprot:6544082-Alexandrium_andersonii.AAC.1